MNESYFESIIAIFDENSSFLSILDTFWAIYGQFSFSTSINDPLTIELNYLLNWISRIFFNWLIFWIESWVKQYHIIFEWTIFWQNSNIESNNVGYPPPLVHSTVSSVGNLMYCIWSLAKKGVLKTIPLILLSDSKNVNHYRVHWRLILFSFIACLEIAKHLLRAA